MVLPDVTVRVPVLVKGEPEPVSVMVPVPVVSVAAAETVRAAAVIVGLFVAPVAPAFVPLPMVRLLATV